MFTGIVEELGKVKKITQRSGITRLEISAKQTLIDTKIGDSIALNGVCLTAVAIGDAYFSFEVMQQTLKNTNLGLFRIGQMVNLERSLKVGDRISGHFVSGHIDCLGLIRRKVLRNGNLELAVAIPVLFMKYCLAKGSISLDGVSLTLANQRAGVISVNIIPHTLKNTTLSFKGPSDKLNVEFDMLAKKTAT
ncbi:MAG: riboflavin synthase [Candidatus Omnitrophica bacterium]|nr:riboflavin synthase [Candidatus Omnitrophota bacterium]MBU4303467.1 riboflavin synthase [Candidatus Omnitrophota bacterium]MBU4419258.1 riboflavin synthase [Candidatus Omnitrophota bacterium]MBU4467472.1 riboflavin synthase [Candidatus Omnitrophota bacterium]MCG2708567.1 riboflavin synthase [Candidatus Omnitrophota bacterium]